MMRRIWKFKVDTDAGPGYLTGKGELERDPFHVANFVGTSRQADSEASRRVKLYEETTDGTVDQVLCETQGRAL